MVSIHAPAWGATLGIEVEDNGEEVSIHAPAWGATFDYRGFGGIRYVSIHAPAWGATSSGDQAPAPCPCFNPRARVGRDYFANGNGSSKRGFNPRARVGRDRCRRPTFLVP